MQILPARTSSVKGSFASFKRFYRPHLLPGYAFAKQRLFQIFGNHLSEGDPLVKKGGRGARKAAKVKTIGVGKRGSIVIAKDLVESLGIGANDKFTVRKTKAGIALRRVDE